MQRRQKYAAYILEIGNGKSSIISAGFCFAVSMVLLLIRCVFTREKYCTKFVLSWHIDKDLVDFLFKQLAELQYSGKLVSWKCI
jgi:hypothetical protein